MKCIEKEKKEIMLKNNFIVYINNACRRVRTIKSILHDIAILMRLILTGCLTRLTLRQ